jgi:hypothetical protein
MPGLNPPQQNGQSNQGCTYQSPYSVNPCTDLPDRTGFVNRYGADYPIRS